MHRILVVLCYLCIVATNAAHAKPVQFDETLKGRTITEQVEYLITEKSTPLDQVNQASSWTPSQPARFLETNQALWGRVEAKNTGQHTLDIIFALVNPSIEEVDFYLVDQQGDILFEQAEGDYREPLSYNVNLNRYFAGLQFTPNQTITLYFKVVDLDYLTFSVELWQDEDYFNNEENRVAFVGIFIGAFALLSFIYFVSYVIFRRNIRLWFASINLLFLLLFSNFEGIIQNILGTYFDLVLVTSILGAGLTICSSKLSAYFIRSAPNIMIQLPYAAGLLMIITAFIFSGYWQSIILITFWTIAGLNLLLRSSIYRDRSLKFSNTLYRIGWLTMLTPAGTMALLYISGYMVSKQVVLWFYFVILLGGLVLAAAIEEHEKELASKERIRHTNTIASLKQFYTIFRNSVEGLYTSNLDGKLVSLNPAMANLFGYENEQDMLDTLPDTRKLYANIEDRQLLIDTVVKDGHAMDMEFQGVKKDGSRFWFAISVQFIEEGNEKLFTGSIIDISDRKKIQDNLEFLANHDSLTGLYNRRAFERHMTNSLNAAMSNRTPVDLLYLDLDQFKVVNDTCGHKAGDILLARLTKKLEKVVDGKGMLARLGGDEFGVLIEGNDTEQTQAIANELLDTVKSFEFYWDQRLFTIGVSIGMVAFDQNVESLEHMLSMADAACYMSKEQGRNQIHVYSDQDEDIKRYENEIGWVNQIKSALEQNKFALYYQHYLQLSGDDEGYHYEVLLRLIDDSGRVISPGVFLPAAERFDLAGQIDQWVVQHTFEWLSLHPEHLANLTHCNINLSGYTVSDKEAKAFIMNCFDRFNIPFNKICFEITESMAIVKIEEAIHFINEFKQKGCHFALDDFGSGFSSYGYLKKLPVDFLKIDGSFVRDILNDKVDSALVTSINDVAKVFGMHTVAEFVEDEDTIKHLNHIGIDYAQGYAISKPKPLANFEPYLDKITDTNPEGVLPV